MLEIEKKESKTCEYFSENTRVDQPEPSVQSEQAGLELSSRVNGGNYQELKLASKTSENKLPCLKNSSEEKLLIWKNENKIKEQLGTMKVQNEFHLRP